MGRLGSSRVLSVGRVGSPVMILVQEDVVGAVRAELGHFALNGAV